MTASRSPLLKLLGMVLVASVFYFLAYLALAQREPVYKSNKLRQMRLVMMNDFGNRNPIEVKPSDPPDGYLLKYRLRADWVTWMFAPAHRLDRLIRPQHWPVSYGC